MTTTRPVDAVTMPPRIAKLPRNAVGYPIPWFVATLPDGTRDFRIADQERHFNALKFRLCWICGQSTGANVAFTIGPMCAVNRISSEPPAGEPILRNPGVALVWVTRSFRTFRAPLGNAGYLCQFGGPIETLWFAEGRAATRTEVMASIDSGLPALQEACQRDDDPAGSLRLLGAQVAQALTLVPAS